MPPPGQRATTQVLAELFRENGVDGIRYRSAVGIGHNLALFDLGCADVISGQLYKIDKLDIGFTEADNPYFVRRSYEEATKQSAGPGARARAMAPRSRTAEPEAHAALGTDR